MASPRPALVPVPVSEIGNRPRRILLEADAGERESIARRLKLPAVLAVSMEAEVAPSGSDGFAAKATLRATVRRTCVVTLEEFEETLESAFEARFAPTAADAPDDGEDPVEEIRDGALPLGELAVEHLSLGLSAYPRHPDAPPPGEADWVETQPGDPASPLAAALRELRSS